MAIKSKKVTSKSVSKTNINSAQNSISVAVGPLVAELAQTHVQLWHEEDKARSPIDAEVVNAKRNIDKLNQKRNDLIEKIDEAVLQLIPKN